MEILKQEQNQIKAGSAIHTDSRKSNMNKSKQRQAIVTQEQAKICYKNRKEKLTTNINKKKIKAVTNKIQSRKR